MYTISVLLSIVLCGRNNLNLTENRLLEECKARRRNIKNEWGM